MHTCNISIYVCSLAECLKLNWNFVYDISSFQLVIFRSRFISVMQVVHFKGSRKRLMLESWNFYSSTSNIADMLCLILGSGRTKYDF
jgi:hypothetical protein